MATEDAAARCLAGVASGAREVRLEWFHTVAGVLFDGIAHFHGAFDWLVTRAAVSKLEVE